MFCILPVAEACLLLAQLHLGNHGLSAELFFCDLCNILSPVTLQLGTGYVISPTTDWLYQNY